MADKNSGWRKYFKAAHVGGDLSPISGKNQYGLPGFNRQTGGGQGLATGNDFAFRNYASRLPEVYSGHPNRIERYNQYENMDMDSEVNACLDILSEFSTQLNEENQTPFEIQFKDDPTDNELDIIRKQLQQWTKINKFEQRIFKLFRNTIKYGDQVFIRDPETFELMWVDMVKVSRIIVNESEGKRPEQYVIRDINPNFQNMSISQKTTQDYYVSRATGSVGQTNYTYPNGGAGAGAGGGTGNARFTQAMNETCIDARHVVHLSLNEGLDYFWPFGQSILENIFKVYKQKELLEDSVLIYRVARAPERRVFKIDVGNMPSHLAMQFVERVKNEMHQRRIPTVTGGGANMMDTSYNPLCLDLSTRIPLLDGRTLTLSALIAEFEAGRENWAYSCDPVTGKIVPGVINWAGITRRDAETIRLTFDNGETLVCTPDHKIPVFGRGFVEAQDIQPDDSLIAFNTREEHISGPKTSKYQQVWDHELKQWVWTHRMVGEFFRKIQKHQEFTYLEENIGKNKAVIHHIDSDRFNNDPRNLTYMNKEDHILYHAAQKKEYWEKLSEEQRETLTGKISRTVKENWEKMDEVERQTALYHIRQAQKKAVWLRKNDAEVAARYHIKMSTAQRRAMEANAELLQIRRNNMEKRVKFANQKLNLPFRVLQIIADIVRSGSTNKKEVMRLCEQNNELMNIVREHNSGMDSGVTQNKINLNQFGNKKMDRLIRTNGYKNWKTFVREIANFNHRVVKIERVENRDVGTITIDGTERWHNYHTFAIESGIFVKNSINEDYFFPQTAEGRGSSVETLPGGQNLGEVDDLKYFNNKMARGLRVPSSYLPTGPDDSSVAMNDGKVGTALIQEYRFNQYCKRLQNLIVQKLDDEFKLFLKWRGLSIDSGMFNITFAPPQNFAAYRQSELDTTRIAAFTQLDQFPYFAKRFLMERFLGLTLEEIHRNEELWQEEREEPAENQAKGSDLRTVGVTPGGMTTDTEAGEAFGADMAGAEAPVPDIGGGMPEMPAAAPPPPTAPPV